MKSPVLVLPNVTFFPPFQPAGPPLLQPVWSDPWGFGWGLQANAENHLEATMISGRQNVGIT